MMFAVSVVLERYGFYSLAVRPSWLLFEPESNIDFKQAIRYLMGNPGIME